MHEKYFSLGFVFCLCFFILRLSYQLSVVPCPCVVCRVGVLAGVRYLAKHFIFITLDSRLPISVFWVLAFSRSFGFGTFFFFLYFYFALGI